MTDLTFAQSSRRNYTTPILVALVVLTIAGGLIYHFVPHGHVSVTIPHTAVYAAKIVYKKQPQSGSFKVLSDAADESDLYVIPTIHIDNQLNVPVFLKDFTLTFTTSEGERHTLAVEKNDLTAVNTAFPEMKHLDATPLLRETEVGIGKSAEGTILAQFPIPQSIWDQRQSATVTVDFYHQPSITIPIPTH